MANHLEHLIDIGTCCELIGFVLVVKVPFCKKNQIIETLITGPKSHVK